jgi:riboflavin kinase/FMN adenylyltransferase
MARCYVCRFDYGFAQITAEEFIEKKLVNGLGVRYLLVGDDFRFGARRAGDFGLLRQHASRLGYSVDTMSSVMVEGTRVSSTAVRDALAMGDLARTHVLLGRPYSISGRVVRGDGVGRQLGFPTANVRVAHNRPALSGIFAVEVRGAADRVLRGVASLGVRPTVKQSAEPLLEVYVLDFSGDLYGRRVCVDFLHRFRDELKFADLGALTRQIALDVEAGRAFFAARDLRGRRGAASTSAE